MFRSVLRTGSVCALVAVVFAAVAQAATGPPPPTSTTGKTVQLVGLGAADPNVIRVRRRLGVRGRWRQLERVGAERRRVPVKHGAATKLADSPQFVAGLAWEANALYVSGGYVGSSGAQFEIVKWSGWNGASFAQPRRSGWRRRSWTG